MMKVAVKMSYFDLSDIIVYHPSFVHFDSEGLEDLIFGMKTQL